MPISIVCTHCTAPLTVKDEYAGKRIKCPKCAGILQLPGAAAPIAEVPPPVSETPKAEAEFAFEKGEDKPRAKRREKDEGGEKAKSRKRRRDEDDDEPKKKGGALKVVLIVLGSLFLVCGGAVVGVWFFVLKPAIESATAKFSSKASESKAPEPLAKATPPTSGSGERLGEANVRTVTAGLNSDQVDKKLGWGVPATRNELDRILAQETRAAVRDELFKRWENSAASLRTRQYGFTGDNGILIAFGGPPEQGGKVIGSIGMFQVDSRMVVIETLRHPEPKPGDKTPAATLTPDELLKDHEKYKDKWIVLKGKLKEGSELTGEWQNLVFAATGEVAIALQGPAGKNEKVALNRGDEVEILGKVFGMNPGNDTLQLMQCEVKKRTAGK